MQADIGSQKVSVAQVGSVPRMGVSIEFSAFLDLFHNAQIRGRMHKLCDKATMLFKMMNLNIKKSIKLLIKKWKVQTLGKIKTYFSSKDVSSVNAM